MGKLALRATLRGHTDAVWSVSWSRSGLLASCGADRTVQVWSRSDKSAWTLVTRLSSAETFPRAIRDVAWGSDGRTLACANFDSTATVLELMGGTAPKLEAAVALEGHDSEVKAVSYSSSGGLLATCSRDKSVWIWEVGLDFDYECIAVLNGHTADVKYVTWHPKVELLVSCSYDGHARVWVEDADDWFCAETLSAHAGTVWGAAFDKGGRHLATVSSDSSIVMWRREDPPANVVGGQPRFEVVARCDGLHDGPVYTVDWNAESELIATGGGDDCIRVLRRRGKSDDGGASTGEKASDDKEDEVSTKLKEKWDVIATEQRAHSADVNRVAWCPSDANILASCGDDGLVRIWEYCDVEQAA